MGIDNVGNAGNFPPSMGAIDLEQSQQANDAQQTEASSPPPPSSNRGDIRYKLQDSPSEQFTVEFHKLSSDEQVEVVENMDQATNLAEASGLSKGAAEQHVRHEIAQYVQEGYTPQQASEMVKMKERAILNTMSLHAGYGSYTPHQIVELRKQATSSVKTAFDVAAFAASGCGLKQVPTQALHADLVQAMKNIAQNTGEQAIGFRKFMLALTQNGKWADESQVDAINTGVMILSPLQKTGMPDKEIYAMLGAMGEAMLKGKLSWNGTLHMTKAVIHEYEKLKKNPNIKDPAQAAEDLVKIACKHLDGKDPSESECSKLLDDSFSQIKEHAQKQGITFDQAAHSIIYKSECLQLLDGAKINKSEALNLYSQFTQLAFELGLPPDQIDQCAQYGSEYVAVMVKMGYTPQEAMKMFEASPLREKYSTLDRFKLLAMQANFVDMEKSMGGSPQEARSYFNKAIAQGKNPLQAAQTVIQQTKAKYTYLHSFTSQIKTIAGKAGEEYFVKEYDTFVNEGVSPNKAAGEALQTTLNKFHDAIEEDLKKDIHDGADKIKKAFDWCKKAIKISKKVDQFLDDVGKPKGMRSTDVNSNAEDSDADDDNIGEGVLEHGEDLADVDFSAAADGLPVDVASEVGIDIGETSVEAVAAAGAGEAAAEIGVGSFVDLLIDAFALAA
ncbi:hypothetical protein [Desulfovibrio inopinatus]|uniref:hypothetical protein n=1 Tax=Desulfovibrio inopinatus TaxID=102109 RepID=UPI000414EA16|nr:hypothetical protein [Desulfovibrio inopinatus]